MNPLEPTRHNAMTALTVLGLTLGLALMLAMAPATLSAQGVDAQSAPINTPHDHNGVFARPPAPVLRLAEVMRGCSTALPLRVDRFLTIEHQVVTRQIVRLEGDIERLEKQRLSLERAHDLQDEDVFFEESSNGLRLERTVQEQRNDGDFINPSCSLSDKVSVNSPFVIPMDGLADTNYEGHNRFEPVPEPKQDPDLDGDDWATFPISFESAEGEIIFTNESDPNLTDNAPPQMLHSLDQRILLLETRLEQLYEVRAAIEQRKDP